MSIAEILKTSSGSVGGLAKSKKYGLTAAFSSACLACLAGSPPTAVQVALIAAACVSVIAYVISQSCVEASAARVVAEPDEDIEEAATGIRQIPEPATVTKA